MSDNKCPKCNKDIDCAASKCSNCGFDISRAKFEKQNFRLIAIGLFFTFVVLYGVWRIWEHDIGLVPKIVLIGLISIGLTLVIYFKRKH